MLHSGITGPEAVHPTAYKQGSDPGAVGAGKHWYDTSDDPIVVLWRRNDDDDGWEYVSSNYAVAIVTLGITTANLTTGVRGQWVAPEGGTLIRVQLLCPYDATPDVVIDIWKDVLGSYPPTDADTITGGAEPELVGAQAYDDTTLSGWTTAFDRGDVFLFNVDSTSDCPGVIVLLHYVMG